MNGGPDGRVGNDTAGCVDEVALVEAARSDLAAFGILYRQYLPQLYRYLRSRLESDDDAADLAQTVFLKALEALPGYRRTQAPFAAWLFRIARNALIDAARRPRRSIPLQQLPEAHQPLYPDQHDSLSHFHELIAPLDDNQQELLVLRFVVGLPTREIAAIVGRSDGAVRMQLSRSLRLLKESSDVR